MLRSTLSHRALLTSFAIALVALQGCALLVGEDSQPFNEVYENGLLRYEGSDSLRPASMGANGIDGVRTYRFAPGESGTRGPVCMFGDEFIINTRDARHGSKDLAIFLQGGGVCVTERCLALPSPITLELLTLGETIGVQGVVNLNDSSVNPIADANLVYVPYCDGALFIGDVDRVMEFNGEPRNVYQRGLQNATAAVELAKQRYPDPDRVIIIGTSAGAMGTIAVTALARHYFPHKEILVVNDSGTGILDIANPAFLTTALDELNVGELLPTSCSDCYENGHFVRLYRWLLERDPLMRIGFMTHGRDEVISNFYVRADPVVWEQQWAIEVNALQTEFGKDRVSQFVMRSGAATLDHTFVIFGAGTLNRQVTNFLAPYLLPVLATGDSLDEVSDFDLSVGFMEQEATRAGSSEKASAWEWMRSFLGGTPFDAIDAP